MQVSGLSNFTQEVALNKVVFDSGSSSSSHQSTKKLTEASQINIIQKRIQFFESTKGPGESRRYLDFQPGDSSKSRPAAPGKRRNLCLGLSGTFERIPTDNPHILLSDPFLNLAKHCKADFDLGRYSCIALLRII